MSLKAGFTCSGQQFSVNDIKLGNTLDDIMNALKQA